MLCSIILCLSLLWHINNITFNPRSAELFAPALHFFAAGIRNFKPYKRDQ